MTRKVREIQDLVIDEISLVDKGANQHATVTIAKSADGEKENYMDVYDEQGNPLDPDALDIGDVVYDAEGDAYEIQAENDDNDEDEYEYEDERELMEVGKSASSLGIRAGMQGRAFGAGLKGARGTRAAARAAARRTKAINRNGMGPLTQSQTNRADAYAAFTRRGSGAQMAGIRGVQRAKTGAGSAAAGVSNFGSAHATGLKYAGAGAGVTAVGGGAGYGGAALERRKVRKSADDLRQELSKALTDRDRDEVIAKAFGQIEELAEVAEIAKAAADQERDIRLHQEYFEIAKSYELPNVETNALASALKHMAEALPYEDCEVIGKALQFAAEAQEVLYEEIGSIGGGDNNDVLNMVEAHVDGVVAKSGVSREELVTEVFMQNPEAYDQYLADQRG